MPSTFTPSLRLELQATGENRASWGQKANTVFSLVEEAICGKIDVNIANTDLTLLAQNGASDQARPMFIKFTGTMTANRTVTFPEKPKIYILGNVTVGGFSVVIKVGSSTYTLASNQQKLVYTDGITVWTNDNLITLSSPTARWSIPGTIDDTGRMEVGRSIDFHNANIDTADFAVRLDTGGTTGDLYLTPSIPPGAPGAKIWNAGNDGAGSGMDADLLDGLHASEVFPEVAADGKVYGRKRMPAGIGAWIETPGPYVGFVTGDISMGGAVTAGAGRIAFNTNATFTGTEVASISDIGEIKATTYFTSSSTAAVLAATGTGAIYLRPLGSTNAAQQTTVDANGNMNVAGAVTCESYVKSSGANIVLSGNSGAVFLRPYGPDEGASQAYQTTEGGFRSGFIHANSTGVVTHSFYTNGPVGAGTHGIMANGNGSGGSAAGLFVLHPGHNVYAYMAFHHATVNLWAMYASGPVAASGGFVVSDVRVKSNIHDCNCSDAYSKVRAIPVKAYNKELMPKRADRLEHDEIGWLAHEIEPFIPEAVIDVPVPRMDDKGVSLEPTETRKYTNDRTMLATLWAAVQHQAGMIEKLQAEIKTMKGKA